MDSCVVLLSGGMDSVTLLNYVLCRVGVTEVRALSFQYGQRHQRELDMARHAARRAGVVEHVFLDIGFLGRLTVEGRQAGCGTGSALTDQEVALSTLESLSPEDRRQPPTYVPHRNLVLLSLAAAFAETRGIRDVFYGAQAQDRYGYWDCTSEFVMGLNAVMGLNRRQGVAIHAPFVDLRKAEILRIGLELGVDYAYSSTCYRGGEKACGVCPSCVERLAAFRELGLEDPLPYEKGGI